MGQMGFFDLTNRYAGLDAKNEPLAKIDEVVPWEDFRGRLDAVWRRPDKARKSRAGRKPRAAAGTLVALVCTALLSFPVSDEAQAQTCGTPAAGEIEIWCTMMTIGIEDEQILNLADDGTLLGELTIETTGFRASPALGRLSNMFTYDDVTYTVEGLFLKTQAYFESVPDPFGEAPASRDPSLSFIVEGLQDGDDYIAGPLFDLYRNLTLHIGSDSFALRAPRGPGGILGDPDSVSFIWTNPDLNSFRNRTVRVRLTLGGSAVATLNGLTLDGLTTIDLAETFNIDESGTKSYTATVAGCVSSVTVNPTLSRGDATFKILDESDMTIEDADSAHGYQVNLDEGTNTFKIRVTPKVGSRTETYTVTVTRKAPAFTATLHSVDRRDFGNQGVQGVRYRFDVKLCEPVWIPYMDMRDHAFEVTNGSFTKAKRIRGHQRLHNGRLRMFSDHWRMTVEATNPTENVTVALHPKDCDRRGAVCTARGIKLGNSLSLELEAPEQPLSVSIAAATGSEEDGYIDIPVTLSRATKDFVEVDFSTEDGTAKAGVDYWPVANGLRVFAPGETSLVIRVRLIDDDIAEENEVMDIRLTAARLVHHPGGWIKGPVAIDGDGSAAGAITDTDPATQQSDEPGTALTAAFRDVPASHDGEAAFTFELAFSESIPGLSHATVRDSVLNVSGGLVMRARRLEAPSNRRWEVTVEPSGVENVSISLPPTADCTAAGAICVAGGRMLSNGLATQVRGPVTVSVADAGVREAEGATLDFAVTLSRALTETVTVDWATSDGTATAGSDYTAGSGTLTFTAGETSKTVSVPVLDDAIDEGEETLTLTLSNASGGGAWLKDDTATGTIVNNDPMPQAWLARFGRTVASQAVDAIGGRMQGGGGNHVTVGGQALPLSGGPVVLEDDEDVRSSALEALALGDDAPAGTSRSMTGREVLLGSAFQLSAGGEPGAPAWTAWGRFATGGFEADVDEVRMDADVTTGFLGADVARERWLAGVALSLSEGEGSFAFTGTDDEDRGEVESSLTAVYLYLRHGLGEKVDVWGFAGFGEGELTLTLRADADRTAGETYETDIAMRMGAVGLRGEVLTPEEPGGLTVAVRSDAFWVRTTSERVPGLMGSEADVSRLRLLLEGSRSFEAGSGTLTPTLELGLRHDGGDAETGTGIEAGAGLRYAGDGFSVEGSVRTLIAHEESGYKEWGAAGAVRIDPGESGRGLSLTVTPTWGAASSGTERLWSLADTRGLAPDADFEAGRRLEGELGYGLGLGHAPGVLTPYTGLSLADGGGRAWRAGARWAVAPGAALGLEATRSESGGDAESVNGLMLRGTFRW